VAAEVATADTGPAPDWLHPLDVDKAAAGALLSQKPDGAYMVRRRKDPAQFVLSVNYKGRATHHLIAKNEASGKR
jgi:hypothetical protein